MTSKQITLYRCSGYVEEICGDCPMGKPHKFDDACCGEGDKCERIGNKFCECIEYDRDPCGDPTCPDCTGGDGVSCK